MQCCCRECGGGRVRQQDFGLGGLQRLGGEREAEELVIWNKFYLNGERERELENPTKEKRYTF